MHVMRLHGTPEGGRGAGHEWHISLPSSDEALCGAVWGGAPAEDTASWYSPAADERPHCDACMRAYHLRLTPEAAPPLV